MILVHKQQKRKKKKFSKIPEYAYKLHPKYLVSFQTKHTKRKVKSRKDLVTPIKINRLKN